MDWDKLKTFYAVAQAESFTRASKTLNLTQPSLSRKIQTLEEELKTSLFHRHARGLVLTEQGEILYETVSGIIKELSDVEKNLKHTKQNDAGFLTITISEFIGSSWLFSLLPDFSKRYPKIQLSTIVTDLILNLDMREADIAIRLFKPTQQDLIQKKLYDVTFQLTASKEYLDLYGRPQATKDLQDHTLIAYPRGMTAPFPNPNWYLKTANIDLQTQNKQLLTSSYSSLSSFIKKGCGIGALTHSEIKEDPTLEVILPHDFTHKAGVYFVYAMEHKNSNKIALLRDFLIENRPLL